MDSRVKIKRINRKEFILIYMIMLILVGFQAGIIALSIFKELPVYIQILVTLAYWAFVALIFCLLTNWQIKKGYDKPMRRLSSAAKKVANGDFSVYIEPFHTADCYNYIDVMFLDFNKMVEELGSIETLKNDFVADVSHEIKTPLAVIQNYTSALQKINLSEEEKKEYMDTIIQATNSLSTLISNILRLNKLDHQEIETTKEEYDLVHQLYDCVLQYESLWEEKKIKIHFDIEDRAMIFADKNMLEIIWNNLLSNSLKYTEANGEVSLVQTADAESITVTVSDTGCGMDEKTMAHIFDKFYQGDTSRASDGNGLGLSLVSRIIDRVGGTIEVTSEVNVGTTFKVTLIRI